MPGTGTVDRSGLGPGRQRRAVVADDQGARPRAAAGAERRRPPPGRTRPDRGDDPLQRGRHRVDHAARRRARCAAGARAEGEEGRREDRGVPQRAEALRVPARVLVQGPRRTTSPRRSTASTRSASDPSLTARMPARSGTKLRGSARDV